MARIKTTTRSIQSGFHVEISLYLKLYVSKVKLLKSVSVNANYIAIIHRFWASEKRIFTSIVSHHIPLNKIFGNDDFKPDCFTVGVITEWNGCYTSRFLLLINSIGFNDQILMDAFKFDYFYIGLSRKRDQYLLPLRQLKWDILNSHTMITYITSLCESKFNNSISIMLLKKQHAN